jgi:hypothetical protein
MSFNDSGRAAALDAITEDRARGTVSKFLRGIGETARPAGEFRKRAATIASTENRISKSLVDQLAKNGIGLKPSLGLIVDDSGVAPNSTAVVKAIQSTGPLQLAALTGLPPENVSLVANTDAMRRATGGPSGDGDATFKGIRKAHERGPGKLEKGIGLPPESSNGASGNGPYANTGATNNWRDESDMGAVRTTRLGPPHADSVRNPSPLPTRDKADSQGFAASLDAIKGLHAAGPKRGL